jgi:hypothetical protein
MYALTDASRKQPVGGVITGLFLTNRRAPSPPPHDATWKVTAEELQEPAMVEDGMPYTNMPISKRRSLNLGPRSKLTKSREASRKLEDQVTAIPIAYCSL